MRAITFVQAFQYWLKLTALADTMIFLALHWQAERPAQVAEPRADVPATTTAVDSPVALIVTRPSCSRVDGTVERDLWTANNVSGPGPLQSRRMPR